MFYLVMAFGVLWFLVCSLAMIVVSLILFRHPSNGYVFARILNFGIGLVSGVRVEVRNRQRLYESRPCVYVANHQSNVDIVIQSYTYLPRTVAIGKKEVLYIPLFGILFWLTGNLLLDRSNHEKAMKSMARAAGFLKSNRGSIFIFPEGHRNRGAEELLPFKKGAFHLAIDAQVPIVPIVAGPIKAFVDETNHRIRRGTIPIEVLEPLSTKGLGPDDVDTLIEKTRSLMQTQFDKLKAEVKPFRNCQT